MKYYYILDGSCNKYTCLFSFRFNKRHGVNITQNPLINSYEFELAMSENVFVKQINDKTEYISDWAYTPLFYFESGICLRTEILKNISLIEAETKEQFLEYWDRLTALNETENRVYLEKDNDTFWLDFTFDYIIKFIQNDTPIPNKALTNLLLNCVSHHENLFNEMRYGVVNKLYQSGKVELAELTPESLQNYIDSQIGKTLKWTHGIDYLGDYYIQLVPIESE